MSLAVQKCYHKGLLLALGWGDMIFVQGITILKWEDGMMDPLAEQMCWHSPIMMALIIHCGG